MTKTKRRTKKEFKDYNDYHDRSFGLKWGTAFALDELVGVIESNKRAALYVTKKLPQMTRQEIDIILQQAFLKSKVVSVQCNIIDSHDNLLESIEGRFQGNADETYLFIEEQRIAWEDIRNVSFVE